MKSENLFYLVAGIVVWGAVAGGAASLITGGGSREVTLAVAACVVSAALAVLVIWVSSKKGFSADPPCLWFFLPMMGLLYIGFQFWATNPS